jgi:VWFA-related protein
MLNARRRACAVALAVLLGGSAPVAQRPTFRVQVDAIELEAFVTDPQGLPVAGLSIGDFKIFEDGKPQVITSFSHVDIPFAPRPAARPDAAPVISPDVQSNEHADGRLYVFALDEVTPTQALRTRAFLHRFIERNFAANDRAAVFFLGQQSTIPSQPFTNDARLLTAAIDRFTGAFPEVSAATPLKTAGGQGPTSPPPAPIDTERLLAERGTMTGFQSIVEMLAGIHDRRKALLLLSSGLGPSLFRALSYQGGVMSNAEETAHAAIMAATRGNVTIYPVDPRGLTAEGAEGEAEAPPGLQGAAELDTRMSLRLLAEATGGFALVSSNGVTAAFDRIVAENSSYYLIGFVSSNDRRDGRHRRLEVRVDRPGVRVRTRDGYVAPLKNERLSLEPQRVAVLSAPVSNALVNPVSGGDVVIRLAAAPFKRTGKDANVALVAEIDPAALGLVARDGIYSGAVEIGFLATEPLGKIHAGEHYLSNLALKQESYGNASRHGIRVLSEIALPPGRSQIRFAAGSPSGKSGNVVYDIVVPDFAREPLSLSGIALTSAMTTGVPTIGARNALQEILPRPPTAMREFSVSDTIMIAGEAYESRAVTPNLALVVELRADDGRIEHHTTGTGARISDQIPLSALAPGRYYIHVEATQLDGERRSITRDTPIRVY